MALINNVWASQLRYPDRDPQPWPFRRIDKGFNHLELVAGHLPLKLERAASEYAVRSREFAAAILSQRFGLRDEDLAVPLDATIVYVRLIPDFLAAVTPYFYANASPASGSFREQIKWFTKTRSGFDHAYEEMLRSRTSWFELLAGKEDKGLRDLLIHRFGKFQFPVTTAPEHLRGEVSADFFTAAGYHYDAAPLLVKIVRGLFDFLDSYVEYFNARVADSAGWSPLRSSLDNHGLLASYKSLPESHWLLPVIPHQT